MSFYYLIKVIGTPFSGPQDLALRRDRNLTRSAFTGSHHGSWLRLRLVPTSLPLGTGRRERLVQFDSLAVTAMLGAILAADASRADRHGIRHQPRRTFLEKT
jgi:hypothetical protein